MRTSQALGALLVLAGLPTAVVGLTQGIALLGLEPAAVVPYEGFSLVLTGQGFEPGLGVRIEGSSPGRFLRYEPSALTAERCEVELPLGFGPKPASRRVYVESADGRRTEMIVLAIRKLQPEAAVEAGPLEPSIEESEQGQGDDVTAEVAPSISELSPARLLAGRAVVLEVFGEHFTEESAVWVRVNVNAGSSRLPEYELRPFATVFVDTGLLEVEFKRGFYPVPGARDIVVENPGGVRSMPAVLTIEREDGR